MKSAIIILVLGVSGVVLIKEYCYFIVMLGVVMLCWLFICICLCLFEVVIIFITVVIYLIY